MTESVREEGAENGLLEMACGEACCHGDVGDHRPEMLRFPIASHEVT